MTRQRFHHPSTVRRGGFASLRGSLRSRAKYEARSAMPHPASHFAPRTSHASAASLARSGPHRWLDLRFPRSGSPLALTPEEHLTALQEFLRQTQQATEPAEVLWRLCDFCTEVVGLSAAEAYLACG